MNGQASKGDAETEYRRLLADESPFVTQMVPGDNGPEYTPWYRIERPGEWREMEERFIADRFVLFALRVQEFDEYLTHRAQALHKLHLTAAALLLLSVRNQLRDLFAGWYKR